MKKFFKSLFKYLGLTLLTVLILKIFILGSFTFMSSFKETKQASEIAPATGRFIQTPGGKIFIQEMGPERGKPIIFINGFFAWSETWRDALRAMSSHGYRAIALDLPPFGFSDRPRDSSYTTRDQAQRILNLTDTMKLQKPILVGHSFGAAPTVEAAMMAPDKFSGLVLIDAAVNPDFKKPESENLILKYFLKTNSLRNSLLSATATNPYLTRTLLQRFIYDPEDATDKIVKIYQQPLSLYRSTNDFGDWLPSLIFPQTDLLSQSKESYRNLKLPALIIWGEKDKITPISIGYQLDELIPDSKMSILEEVGHIPQIEDVDQLNDSLILGLKDLKL